MFVLLYTRDADTCRHLLRPGDTVVGRAPICDLSIDDPSISRRHVRFRVHGDHCMLTDLGGRNGTFLNGEQVTEAPVKAGDKIVLGRFPILIDDATAEPLMLSDEHSIVESADGVIRHLDDAQTRTGVKLEADAGRLLLLLGEISRQLVSWGPLDDLLNRIVSVAFDTLPADRGFLLLLDESSGQLTPRIARSRDRTPVSGASISRMVVRRVVEERVAMLAIDVPRAGWADAPGQDEGSRSFASTPLCAATRTLGVLYVDSPSAAALQAADLDVLQALAGYAAAAIEQSLLREPPS